jgi:phosphatidate cytidylyltransferase
MVALWVLLLAFAPAWLFWLVLLAGGGVAFREYYLMTMPSFLSSRRIAVIGISLLPVIGALSGQPAYVLAGMIAALFGFIILVSRWFVCLDDVLGFLGTTGFAVFYIGSCLSHLVLLRFLEGGVGWLAILAALTVGADTGAYFIGRRFGSCKLCPNISPGKTVEGAVGGLFFGITAALLVAFFLPDKMINPSFVFVLFTAIILAPVSIMGDLAESVLKRASGVKDSGVILAGHGGLLDRVDSLLLTAPVLYYILFLFPGN